MRKESAIPALMERIASGKDILKNLSDEELLNTEICIKG